MDGFGRWFVFKGKKKMRCPVCHRLRGRAHLHHITYRPPRTVLLCPRCHGKIHGAGRKKSKFRPSVYRICLRLIREKFEGGTQLSAEEIAQSILNDPNRAWRHHGIGRPTWREALMAARIWLQLRGGEEAVRATEG